MVCIYCKEKDESRLMMRSQVVRGKVETINVCLQCWWSKEVHTDGENGNLLSEQKPTERRIPDQPEPSHSGVGKAAS